MQEKKFFLSIRYNDLRVLTTKMSKVYIDIEIEPKLILLSGEESESRISTQQMKKDLTWSRARGVWEKDNKHFKI